MAQDNLFLIPKGALVKEGNKDTDAKVGVITEMFLILSPSRKGMEGEKKLETPVCSECLVQCGTDTDKSLESIEATESMEKGAQGVILRLAMQ